MRFSRKLTIVCSPKDKVLIFDQISTRDNYIVFLRILRKIQLVYLREIEVWPRFRSTTFIYCSKSIALTKFL